MKFITYLLLLTAFTICLATEKPRAEDFFAHPRTKITLTVGDVNGHSISSENYHRQTRPVVGDWVFRNGLGYVLKEKELGEVKWEFIKRSQYGDIYVFSMKTKNGNEKIIPVLFHGEPILMEFENIKFFIETEK
ncbi:MAG: hypothetical protein ACFE0O_12435 [Opitutales bacterium]